MCNNFFECSAFVVVTVPSVSAVSSFHTVPGWGLRNAFNKGISRHILLSFPLFVVSLCKDICNKVQQSRVITEQVCEAMHNAR